MDEFFVEFFTATTGAPALPTRLISGLQYLKPSLAHSDEEVVAHWVENSYRLYFCSVTFFQHQLPCHLTRHITKVLIELSTFVLVHDYH